MNTSKRARQPRSASSSPNTGRQGGRTCILSSREPLKPVLLLGSWEADILFLLLRLFCLFCKVARRYGCFLSRTPQECFFRCLCCWRGFSAGRCPHKRTTQTFTGAAVLMSLIRKQMHSTGRSSAEAPVLHPAYLGSTIPQELRSFISQSL